MSESSLNALINPALDWNALKKQYQQTGRIEIRSFFQDEFARQLRDALCDQVPWGLAHNAGGKAKNLSAKELHELTATQLADLWRVLSVQAQTQFSFYYGTYMMVSAYLRGEQSAPMLNRLIEQINQPDFLENFRQLTGCFDIRKADAQATRYTANHFLTSHDDHGAPSGQIRRAAYVLSLSEHWQSEWGGLLHFFDEAGNIIESFTPRFNSLFLFRTPQMHAVSLVAPEVQAQRLSITGWFRAD